MTTLNDDHWPRHSDGRRKKMGEMTKEEASQALKPVLIALKTELESPEFLAAVESEPQKGTQP